MTPRHVKIIYNDDGHDIYNLDGKQIDLDNITSTVRDVEGALRSKGFQTSAVPLNDRSSLEGFIKEISRADGSMIFNLCEGALLKSAFEMHIAALLELHGAAFTGSGPLALGLSLDKGLTKDILVGRGIPTPGHFIAEEPPLALPEGLKFPLIVKPLREDASIGIDANAVVKKFDDLKKRVEFINASFTQPAIVEEYIDGREFNISVLGNGKGKQALPPSEILFVDYPAGQPRICCYEAKWVEESQFFNKTVPSCPAKITASLKNRLHETALKAYEAMGCRDYARVDVRVSNEGGIKVLEVNPNPDISADAGFARAAKAAGLEYPDLIEAIVDAAIARSAAADAACAASGA